MYDVFEANAVTKKVVHVRLASSESKVERHIIITDVFSSNKQEFLSAVDQTTQEEIVIRLDHILSLTDPATGQTYTPASC